MDVMPTVLAAAGAKYSDYEKCDGINLLPYITQGKKPEREAMVWDTGFAWAIRKGNWKLKVTTDQKSADRIAKKQHTDLGTGIELYNLFTDIEEKENVADKNPAIVAELTQLYQNWRNETTVEQKSK